MYTTPSHSLESPRARVVFVLSTPIHSGNAYEGFMLTLVDMFGSDQVCKDATRIFYGSSGCDIRIFGNVLPLKMFEYKYVRPYAKELQRKQAEREELRKNNKNIVVNGSGTYVMNLQMNRKIQELVSTPPGSRADKLLKVAYYFGGIVANGYELTEDDAKEVLSQTAQDAWGDCNMRVIDTTIRNGFRAGLRNPVDLIDTQDINKFF
jgi:hypothetical protein